MRVHLETTEAASAVSQGGAVGIRTSQHEASDKDVKIRSMGQVYDREKCTP